MRREELEREADAVGQQATELSKKLKHTETEIEETRKEKEQLREEEKLLKYATTRRVCTPHECGTIHTTLPPLFFFAGRRRSRRVWRCSTRSSASLPLRSATLSSSTRTGSMYPPPTGAPFTSLHCHHPTTTPPQVHGQAVQPEGCCPREVLEDGGHPRMCQPSTAPHKMQHHTATHRS